MKLLSSLKKAPSARGAATDYFSRKSSNSITNYVIEVVDRLPNLL
jgi:hypothetical protein